MAGPQSCADPWPRRVTPAFAADLAAGHPSLLFLLACNPESPVTSVVAAAPNWQPRRAHSWLLLSGSPQALLAVPWCCPAPSFLCRPFLLLAVGPSCVQNFGSQGKPLASYPVKTTTPSWTLPRWLSPIWLSQPCHLASVSHFWRLASVFRRGECGDRGASPRLVPQLARGA